MTRNGKLLALALLSGSSLNVAAWGGNNGWDWNPWPAWTPMYWMEEMVGGNDWYNGTYDNGPYGYSPYGYGYNPYGYSPVGNYGTPYYGSYGGYPFTGYTPYYNAPWP
jgi:hypothetical protein